MKFNRLLAFCLLAAFLSGCASIPKVQFDKLENRDFDLATVSFGTYVAMDGVKIADVFAKLPVQDAVKQTAEKYGIAIHTDFFDGKENVANNIKQYQVVAEDGTVSYFPMWNVTSASKQSQQVSVSFNWVPEGEYLRADVRVSILEGDKVISSVTDYLAYSVWFPVDATIADKSTAAVLSYNKNIKIVTINNEPLGLYRKDNQEGPNGIYVPADTDQNILCYVEDPGNLFYKAATFSNIRWKGKLDSGKRYTMDYKINRTFLMADWTAELTLTEDK
jgi:hypothetical protein